MNLNAIFEYSNFSEIKTVIIGVSGGSDSLTLFLSFVEYCKTLNIAPPKIIVVTIDHKLRNESASEAIFVKNICTKYNIEHHIVEWNGKTALNNLAQAARLARYKILYDIAKNYHKSIIMVGHNLNDRIETYIMRKKRNSFRGLSSIAKISLLFNKIYLWRPLLDVSKMEIQNYLLKNKHNWIEDPTNLNLKYERAATRHALGFLSSEQLQNWKNILINSENERLNFNNKVIKILKNLNIIFQGECLQITITHTYNSSEFLFSLALLSSIMGGVDYIAGAKQIVLIEALLSKDKGKINICRSILEKNNNIIYIWRENRNINPIICEANSTIIWDNRYKIFNKSEAPIIIRTAKANELKTINKSLTYNLKNRSCLLIEKQNELLIPFIPEKTYKTLSYNFHNIEIAKHLPIYSWLVNSFDFNLYNILKNIYNL